MIILDNIKINIPFKKDLAEKILGAKRLFEGRVMYGATLVIKWVTVMTSALGEDV